jgi:hypothetical protein
VRISARAGRLISIQILVFPFWFLIFFGIGTY